MFFACHTLPLSIADTGTVWNALRSPGHVALLRHAIAPGTSDPQNFALGNCDTQRNLSDEGREQAMHIGERFRANGIETAQVFSSQWCRCLETARLLGLSPVEELPALNSFFQQPELRDSQMSAIKSWLSNQLLNSPTVLVTHRVNISALTGVYPTSGELVVIRWSDNNKMTIVGTIQTD